MRLKSLNSQKQELLQHTENSLRESEKYVHGDCLFVPPAVWHPGCIGHSQTLQSQISQIAQP